MKRIMYVGNALKPNTDKLRFAIYISKLTNAGIKALFHVDQEESPADSAWISQFARQAGIPPNEDTGTLKKRICDRHIHEFKTRCEADGVPCTVRKSEKHALREVILESRYADLILLDVEIAFSDSHVSIPTAFAEEVLRLAECPVITLPDAFNKIDELVFTYDGKISSVYAIKQFTYLFPEFRAMRVSVVSVNPDVVNTDERYRFLEWLHGNYTNINYYAVEGDERKGLLEILLQHNDAIILMGAYGRSRFSTFIKPSHASNVLKMTNQPVFIIHP